MSQSFSSRKRSYWRSWEGVMVSRWVEAKVESSRSDSRVPLFRLWSVDETHVSIWQSPSLGDD